MKRTARQLTEATIADLYRAMDRRHPITITYVKADGTATVRTIETYDIRTTGAGDVIVKAMDRQSRESRTFRVDRLVSYSVHRTAYRVPVPADVQPAPVPVAASEVTARELAREDRAYWTDRYTDAA